MKTLKLLILMTGIISLVVVSSCKKDDDNNPNNNAQQYETKTVDVPDGMAQSSDPGAQQATAYLNMVNSMATYGSMMTPPSKSTPITNLKDGGTEVYTWEVNEGMNNYTVTLTIIETLTMYNWEMSITGTIDTYTFTNFVYIRAETTKDGMNSSITLYEFDGSGIAMTMSWQDNGNGTTTFTFEVPGSIRLTVGVNADGSGWMDVYEWNGQSFYLDFRIEWNASGHGEWWEYIDGTISDSGSF